MIFTFRITPVARSKPDEEKNYCITIAYSFFARKVLLSYQTCHLCVIKLRNSKVKRKNDWVWGPLSLGKLVIVVLNGPLVTVTQSAHGFVYLKNSLFEKNYTNYLVQPLSVSLNPGL